MTNNVAALPNFIICGAPKSGTSSLHRWMSEHPDVLSAAEKETYFFMDPGTHMFNAQRNASNGLDAYRDLFKSSGVKPPTVIMESTPAYIYQKTALNMIPGLPSRPKCLFIVREPSAQIYSLFQYFKNNWDWIPGELCFSDYIDSLARGDCNYKGNELAENAIYNARYYPFLDEWAKRLDDSRMYVCTFDELKKDPKTLVKKISIWIGLDPAFFDSYSFPRDNETYSVRSSYFQKINIKIRGLLPRGKLYDALRSVYRKVNTKVPSKMGEEDKLVLERLAQSFAVDNGHLKSRFKLDLQDWPVSLPGEL